MGESVGRFMYIEGYRGSVSKEENTRYFSKHLF